MPWSRHTSRGKSETFHQYIHFVGSPPRDTLVLDGNSGHVAHVWKKTGILFNEIGHYQIKSNYGYHHTCAHVFLSYLMGTMGYPTALVRTLKSWMKNLHTEINVCVLLRMNTNIRNIFFNSLIFLLLFVWIIHLPTACPVYLYNMSNIIKDGTQ